MMPRSNNRVLASNKITAQNQADAKLKVQFLKAENANLRKQIKLIKKLIALFE
jgi:hypothetical protein